MNRIKETRKSDWRTGTAAVASLAVHVLLLLATNTLEPQGRNLLVTHLEPHVHIVKQASRHEQPVIPQIDRAQTNRLHNRNQNARTSATAKRPALDFNPKVDESAQDELTKISDIAGQEAPAHPPLRLDSAVIRNATRGTRSDLSMLLERQDQSSEKEMKSGFSDSISQAAKTECLRPGESILSAFVAAAETLLEKCK